MSQIPKSVVREIRTLRSVGVGTTFSVVPSTRRQLGNRLFYRDKSFLAIALADKMMDNIFLNGQHTIPTLPFYIHRPVADILQRLCHGSSCIILGFSISNCTSIGL